MTTKMVWKTMWRGRRMKTSDLTAAYCRCSTCAPARRPGGAARAPPHGLLRGAARDPSRGSVTAGELDDRSLQSDGERQRRQDETGGCGWPTGGSAEMTSNYRDGAVYDQ